MKKQLKISLAVSASALLFAAPAFAFHSGGVAECEGCHTMHNSNGGVQMTTAFPQYQSGPFLLKGTDQSSACLNCHGAANDTAPSSYHIYDNDPGYGLNDGIAPANMPPGGDFAWLKKSYSWSPRSGTTETSAGERHGHNIVAADFGFTADTTLTAAPGGTYPAASLACSSCHDPHGKYRRDSTGAISTTGLPIVSSGSYATSADPTTWGAVGAYRILGGIGYTPKSLGTNAFVNSVPAAVAPSSYNRTEATTQTRVAYGSGMSEWCANCHSSIHRDTYTSGTSGLSHPAGNAAKLGTAIAANYNAYKKSGDLTGTAASAFNSLVPFEEGSADYTTLKSHALTTDAFLQGADATSNVACISCHRVHASGFDAMTRYDAAGIEYMTLADANGVAKYGDPAVAAEAKVAMGRSAAEYTAAMYGRPATAFAPYQRNLCNKCHAKD